MPPKGALKIKPMLLVFYLFLLFLLILHVSFNYIFIYPNRTYKIPPWPKMISPIRFLLQLWITLEHFDRYFTFQRSKQNRHGYLGWDRNYKMNVIFLNVQFLYLTPFPFTQHAVYHLRPKSWSDLSICETDISEPILCDNHICKLHATTFNNYSWCKVKAKPSVHNHRQRRWVFKSN